MRKVTDNVAKYLRQMGIRPSVQRIQIFEYLQHSDNHPTVDEIYRQLSPDVPTLSKTTVYNTLGLFVEKGIVLQISIDGAESRYDARVDNHGHFMCERCGEVVDFTADFSNIVGEELAGCTINQKHLYIKGICSSCRQIYEQ